MDKPALYCGTYGKYNDGSIQGKWMYLDDYEDADAFLAACYELHDDEYDPELMFQDFENFPECLYDEAMGQKGAERLYEWLQADDREAIAEYLDEVDGLANPSSAMDNYLGQLDTDGFRNEDEAYGYYCVENGMIEVPENVLPYFDYESYGKEMLQSITITNSGHMFGN